MGIKIEASTGQKACLYMQIVFLCIVVISDIITNVFNLKDMILLSILKYFSFVMVFVLMFISMYLEDTKKDQKSQKK